MATILYSFKKWAQMKWLPSPVWFQEQRLKDFSSKRRIFALSDAQCSCVSLLYVCNGVNRHSAVLQWELPEI